MDMTGNSSKDMSVKQSMQFVLKSTELNLTGKGMPKMTAMKSGERYENGVKRSLLKVKSNYKEFHEADASSSSDFEDGGLSTKM
jgi:hypothetical protein